MQTRVTRKRKELDDAFDTPSKIIAHPTPVYDGLPDDVWREIMEFLCLKDLLVLLRTNSTMHGIGLTCRSVQKVAFPLHSFKCLVQNNPADEEFLFRLWDRLGDENMGLDLDTELEAYRYLMSTDKISDFILAGAFRRAVDKNKLALLKHLYLSFRNPNYKHGCMRVLLRSQYPTTPLDINAVERVVHWHREEFRGEKRLRSLYDMFSLACLKGNICTAQWIYFHMATVRHDTTDSLYNDVMFRCFETAIEVIARIRQQEQ